MGITHRKVNWVLDADIRGFFDNIDHAWLLKLWPFTTNPPKVVLRPPAIFVTTGAWRDGSPNRKLPS
jgi:hypothetical protein